MQAAYSMYRPIPILLPEPGKDFPSDYSLSAWVQMRDFVVSATGPTFYGFIAQSTKDPTQFVLAIRGTQTPEELWDDFTSIDKVPFGVPSCGSVGFGFNRIYQTLEIVERPTGAAVTARSLKPAGSFGKQAATLLARLSGAVAPRVGDVPAGASVTVVGHSLGSALATLYVMENAYGDKIYNPTICTFASPRVGDATFVVGFLRTSPYVMAHCERT